MCAPWGGIAGNTCRRTLVPRRLDTAAACPTANELTKLQLHQKLLQSNVSTDRQRLWPPRRGDWSGCWIRNAAYCRYVSDRQRSAPGVDGKSIAQTRRPSAGVLMCLVRRCYPDNTPARRPPDRLPTHTRVGSADFSVCLKWASWHPVSCQAYSQHQSIGLASLASLAFPLDSHVIMSRQPQQLLRALAWGRTLQHR